MDSCEALFEQEGVWSLNWGEQSITVEDCPIGGVPTAGARGEEGLSQARRRGCSAGQADGSPITIELDNDGGRVPPPIRRSRRLAPARCSLCGCAYSLGNRAAYAIAVPSQCLSDATRCIAIRILAPVRDGCDGWSPHAPARRRRDPASVRGACLAGHNRTDLRRLAELLGYDVSSLRSH
jgi:hypothetical protein